MAEPWQDELDLFMHTFERVLNEINSPGPYNAALAVNAARRAVEESRRMKDKPQKPPPSNSSVLLAVDQS